MLATVVLLQAVGLILSTSRQGTPVGSWLFLEHRWAEAASERFEWAGTILAAVASLVLVFARDPPVRRVAAGLASGWFLAIALARWRIGGVPFGELTVAAHAARIAAPLLLAAWGRRLAVEWLLRLGIAATFAAHGFEALHLHPAFTDYLLAADRNIFGTGVTQHGAETLLRLIGVHDVALALFVLAGGKHRWIVGWMACWGLVTAASRVVQGGEAAMYLVLVRAANAGLPLVWLLLPRRSSMSRTWIRPTGRLGKTAFPLLLLLVPLAAGAQALGDGPGHLRVVWSEEPAHRATVSWSTPVAGAAHEVHLDTRPRGGTVGDYARTVAAGSNGQYTTGGGFYHHADVTGLQPSTTYYFVVASDGQVSEERHFVTAPVDDRPLRLLYGGDSRRPGEAERRTMNGLIAQLAEEDPTILALAHGGDYIQSEDSWEEWASWMEDHALTFTSAGRVLPIVPVRGNHEGDGVMFNEVFGFPGGAQVDYFVTRLGPNAVLVNLDTNVSIGGDQTTWLEAQLGAAQEGRWILASYHRPAYPAQKEPSGARQFWVPLFEQYEVDVALESDGHLLKRTVPIRNDAYDPGGVVYVGEGGLGVPQREPNPAWYLEPPGMAMTGHHVQRFSFSPTELTYEAVLMDGTIADTQVFQPKREGTAVEPGTPPGPEDGFAPVTIDEVKARSATEVAVTFSVDMDPKTTGVASAYGLTPQGEVQAVRLENPRTAVLTTTELLPSAEYELVVRGATSAEGASLPPTPVTFGVPAPGTGPGTPPDITPAAQGYGGGCAAGAGPTSVAGLLVAAFVATLRGRARE